LADVGQILLKAAIAIESLTYQGHGAYIGEFYIATNYQISTYESVQSHTKHRRPMNG